MTDKKGFSPIGGTATLLDDETQTLSPADKAVPALTKKQIEDMHQKQIETMEKSADELEQKAERLAQTDDEKGYRSAQAQASRTRELADLIAEVKITVTGHQCTMSLGRIKYAVNLKSPAKDAIACLSMLVEAYSNHMSLERARKRQKKGKFDYSGMGEIIRKDEAEEAA